MDLLMLSSSALLTLVRRMFVRFGVLAATFGHRAGALLQLNAQPLIDHKTFANLAEARIELFALVAESNDFTLASNVWRDALFEARQWQDDGSHHSRFAERKNELDVLFADLENRYDEHFAKLLTWRKDFERTYLNSANSDPSYNHDLEPVLR